jgi:pyruvate formate lyase activating enzyme
MEEPEAIEPRPADQSVIETRYWHTLEDGRVQCDVCPRACKLRDGQRGLCFVRGAEAGRIKLFSYGRSSGFCVDPIEKKPLNHFLPGTSVLSFGTAGCNLACKFCFPPETLVRTAGGMQRIAALFDSCEEKVPRGHAKIGLPSSLRVWTRAGEEARVSKVFVHSYSGDLLSIKAAGCPPIVLTPNHRVFAAHRSSPHDVHLLEAGTLSTDHCLVVPKRQTVAQTPVSERTSWRDAGDHYLVPLRTADCVPYDGEVYNLEVDDPDHSYLAPFIAVSNCQNWDMSKSREMDTLADSASPEDLAAAARRLGSASVAFTYNDPVVFMEYAIDTAQACREAGVRSVAVTAGYMCPEPRAEFYRHMDAANVDLKGFTERFYYKVCGGELAAVLETLEYLKHETKVWFEITTLLIPGENDSDGEIDQMTQWIAGKLGADVPLHFTAFHPDWKMLDKPPTPPATLSRARHIALANGLHFVYTGNVHDREGGSTWCPKCGARVIERDWYQLGSWELTESGACRNCGAQIPGVFAGAPGDWGARRLGVRMVPRRRPAS